MSCNPPAGGLGPLPPSPSPRLRLRLTKIGQFGSRLSDARALRLGPRPTARFPFSSSGSEARSRSWSWSSSESSSDCRCRMSESCPMPRRGLVRARARARARRRRRSRMWIRVMPRESRKMPERIPTSAIAANERNKKRPDSGSCSQPQVTSFSTRASRSEPW